MGVVCIHPTTKTINIIEKVWVTELVAGWTGLRILLHILNIILVYCPVATPEGPQQGLGQQWSGHEAPLLAAFMGQMDELQDDGVQGVVHLQSLRFYVRRWRDLSDSNPENQKKLQYQNPGKPWVSDQQKKNCLRLHLKTIVV
jgi:hypothetical protein